MCKQKDNKNNEESKNKKEQNNYKFGTYFWSMFGTLIVLILLYSIGGSVLLCKVINKCENDASDILFVVFSMAVMVIMLCVCICFTVFMCCMIKNMRVYEEKQEHSLDKDILDKALTAVPQCKCPRCPKPKKRKKPNER